MPSSDPVSQIETPKPDPAALPGKRYVLGRVHEKRLDPRGYAEEARMVAKARLRPGPAKTAKFLIICRARSGSTLLTTLLGQLPGVHQAGELLATGRLRPFAFTKDVEVSAPGTAFGFKALSYQLAEVQRIPDAEAFLRRYVDDGYKLIHLTRSTLHQAISIAKASQGGEFHLAQGEAARPGHRDAKEVDVENFLNRLRWNVRLLEFENDVMARLPHKAVQYENYLADHDDHQRTIDELADYIGLRRGAVAAKFQKVLAVGLDKVASNADEIRAAVRAAGLGAVLDDGEPVS